MTKILLSIKIFPSDVTVDLNLLKKKINKKLPACVSVYKFVEEPIAFSLVALVAHIIIPEGKSGVLEEVETELQKIDEISQTQTISVQRAL